jgi:hypothetical protein
MTSAHLGPTLQMLKAAFPTALDRDEYFALIRILYEHMSDENLAEAISMITGRHAGIVLNDIYSVASGKPINEDVLQSVSERLRVSGFEAWARDND